MNVYLFYTITIVPVLFILVVTLHVIERQYLRMKYISVSSIIPFAMALASLLLSIYKPYASHSLLSYLFLCIVWCEYLGFIIAGLIAKLFGGGWYTIAEEPMWQCIALIISFVLNTFLIFLVVRITLYRKKKFRSGSTSVTCQ